MNWIQEIKSNENEALKKIYSDYSEAVVSWLQSRYNLSVEDGKEVYQLSVVILYENVMNGKLSELTTDLKSYLIGISRNKAMEMFRKQSKYISTEIQEYIDTSADDLAILEDKERKIEATLNAINSVGDPCRSILQCYYFKRMKMDEITSIMGYKNADTTKNLKYKCIKRLQNIVIDHV